MSKDKSDMWLYYWHLLAPEFPEPLPEFHFDQELGRKHRFDWVYLPQKIAVEIDGGQWSVRGGRHAGDADREKLNLAASLGYIVFRFSPDQLTRNPDACINLVMERLIGKVNTGSD